MIHDFDPDAFFAGVLIGLVVGLVLAAWTYEDDIRRYIETIRLARQDAAAARYRAAVNAEKAERARRDLETSRARWQ